MGGIELRDKIVIFFISGEVLFENNMLNDCEIKFGSVLFFYFYFYYLMVNFLFKMFLLFFCLKVLMNVFVCMIVVIWLK